MDAKQSPIIVPNDLANGYVETSNTDEAAMLRAMGCQPVEGASCRVDHDAKNPYNSGRGKVLFAICGSSSTWWHRSGSGKKKPLPSAQLRRAFAGEGDPSATMDDLIEQVPDEELRARLQNQLPLCIAEYGRAFAENRQQCMALVHTAPHHATGRNRQGRKFSINVKRPDLARKWGA